MVDKIKLFINNNINSISFGFLNGFSIFIGIFLLSKYYLIPQEIENAVNQLIQNSLIYIPYYLINNKYLNKIIDNINQIDIYLLNDHKKEQIKIDIENKNIEKTFLIIIIVIGTITIFLVFVNYYIYHNTKYFNKDLLSSTISTIIILLFEFLFMSVIILKYWYIVIYDIINFLKDNICLSNNIKDCKKICIS